jgi:hypothetical protein
MQLHDFYTKQIQGAIHGLDRIRFRGTLRWLANDYGFKTFLTRAGVLLKDFGDWAQDKTQRIRGSCEEAARALGIETRYLRSSAVDKEALARQLAAEKAIRSGSIAMFSVLESCVAPGVDGNRATKQKEVSFRPRRCVFVYHYWDDPEVGFGHVRLQTWVPFTVQICLNGRHWLEKQLLKQGISYLKDGNCFGWLADMKRAQALLDKQLRTAWPKLLDRLVQRTCPELERVLEPLVWQYYWSADETEYATDLMYRSRADVEALSQRLLWEGMKISDAPSVMRYLGKGGISAAGKIRGTIPDEIVSDYRRRAPGVRIKHWVNQNSVKMYSKAGNVLRVETTINNTRQFKVYRRPNDDGGRAKKYLRMRKGVSDLARRCQVSQRSNERYLEALATTATGETLQETISGVCQPCHKAKRRYRAMAPWNREDQRLMEYLAKGEHAINGFRNAELRVWLYGERGEQDPQKRKKASGRCTRRLALLRAHGLIRKVTKSNRYVVTAKGMKVSRALLTASATRTEELMKLAA